MKINAFEDKASPNVTTSANTANVKSKIFKFVCPDRMTYTLLTGATFLLKLFETTPTEFLAKTRIFIGVKIPSQETPIEIKEFSYAPFKNLTVAQQMDRDNQAALRIDIPQGKITIKEVEELWIEVISTLAISWSATDGSQIEFDMTPVPMG